MARKKKHAEHVNHERWLISYADFITLLFAFFVVMFAVSRVDSKQMGRFTESFSKAVGIDIFPESGKGILATTEGGTGVGGGESDRTRHKAAMDALKLSLSQAKGSDNGVEVLIKDDEIVLRLPVHFAFDSGECKLRAAALPILKTIADTLAPKAVDVRVEGHTDDRPIQTNRFRSNWELSTCRSTAVVLELARAIEPSRLAASGYGEFHPLAGNDTAEGRARNRRVDIVIRLRPPAPPPVVEAGPVPASATAVASDKTDADAGPPAAKEGQ